MGRQLDMFPSGLTRSQFERLSGFVEQAGAAPPAELLQEARDHLERARGAYATNRMINVPMAAAICGAIADVVDRWDTLLPNARSWLAGAVLYFAKCNDDEPDFSSPIGFEDDTEVLNACLRFANQDDLCLNVEDYDDA